MRHVVLIIALEIAILVALLGIALGGADTKEQILLTADGVMQKNGLQVHKAQVFQPVQHLWLDL